MKVKLIALVVAGLFAQSASAQDNFMWGGTFDLGYRNTDVDGVSRNGAAGNPTVLSPTNPLTPFAGPVDGAKAQEYQDVLSAPIGVIDARGSNRTMYLRAFGEEFGRDDQFVNVVGGSFGTWKASLYNNNIPHNYSFNAISPLTGADGGLQQVGPGGTYPNAPNPSIWYPFNYSTQRNTWGGNGEFSGKTPWFVRADYNEVKTTGVKPSSGQLGTGSGNGSIELGAPVDYKTQNTTIEGGYNSRQYGFKIAYLDSKFTDNNDSFQWTNFYLRSALDTTLLPPDNDLKKWSFNGYIKQLPWDSAIIVRYTQSTLENSFGIVGSGLKPTGNAAAVNPAIPPGAAYLLTQPFAWDGVSTTSPAGSNLSNFDGNIKKTSANAAWNASPMAQLDTRVYYNYYDLDNRSTNVSYRAGSQGTNCATPPVNSATCYTLAALTEETGELFSYTKNAAGFDASWTFNRMNKLLGGFDWEGIERHSVDTEAPTTDDYRYWLEYRNSGLEQPERPAEVRVRAATLRPGHPAVDDVRHPLLRGLRRQQLRRQHRQAQPRLDAGPAVVRRLRRDVARPRLQGQLVWPHQRQDRTVRRDRIVGRCREASVQRHRQLGQGREQPVVPGRQLSAAGPEQLRELHLGQPEHPGELDACRAHRLGGNRQADADDVVQLSEDRGRRRLQLGQHDGRRRVPRRSARQLRHRQHHAAALPDQGQLQHQQAVGGERRLRLREVRVRRRPDGRLRRLLSVLRELQHGSRRFGLRVVHRRVRQPGLHQQHGLADGDLQVRSAAAGLRGEDGERQRRRPPRHRHRHPRRHRPPRPPRRCRRSRSTRRCCSTSTRRC